MSDEKSVLTSLAEHRVFGRLPAAEVEGLARVAAPRTFAARQRVFALGDSGTAVFVVLAGWIKLMRTGANGRDIVLGLAGPGSVFGELAAVTGAARGADAVALGESRVVSIAGQAVLGALKRNPDALLELTRIVAERLAAMNAQLEDTLSVSAEVRLARALIRLAALGTAPGPHGPVIDLGLSQKDLGDLTGLSREGTNKQLSAWRDEGWISIEGRVVTLRDPRALQRVADME